MDRKILAEQLRDEASKLMAAASVLDGGEPTYAPLPREGETRRTGSRKMSAATRKKLSLAQRERWAKQKKGVKNDAKK